MDVQTIGDKVVEMIEDAMVAFEREDPDACVALAERDDDVDAACEAASEAVVRDLIEREGATDASEDEIERLMADVSRLLLTIRDLERVGDHAVNVAARTLDMVENDDSLLY